MTATLPASLLVNHKMTPAEWTQILHALAITNLNWVNEGNTLAVSTASTSLINIAGLSMSFTKFYDSTVSDLGVVFMTAHKASVASAVATFAINDGTTDFTTHANTNLVAAKPYSSMGGTFITGKAAGNYTLQARWKASTGTISMDNTGTQSFFVIEVPK